jgi:hypothetical protein
MITEGKKLIEGYSIKHACFAIETTVYWGMPCVDQMP